MVGKGHISSLPGGLKCPRERSEACRVNLTSCFFDRCRALGAVVMGDLQSEDTCGLDREGLEM